MSAVNRWAVWRWTVWGSAVVILCGQAASQSSLARPSLAPVQATAAHAPDSVDDNQCRSCHSYEVDGFARSKMSRSMRLAGQEKPGVVRVPGTTTTTYSDKQGTWQRLDSADGASTFHLDYVVGSGTHASGFITSLGDHLFQSPVAFYAKRDGYELAPGYEGRPNPDFTRPVAEGCLFCHAGSFNPVEGTDSQYGKQPFSHLAITCSRCHGPTAAHLASPVPGSIVNPVSLDRAERDSVCEQCHLLGIARVLNPGKRFTDFQAGQPLEETFTIYHNEAAQDTLASFKVISHVEQLALSQCARNSAGKLWCGTCHDPHNEPTEAVSYYRQKCLQCHEKTGFAADHPSLTSDCISCHMPKRNAKDGGHSAFTDHRIQRLPVREDDDASATASPSSLAPVAAIAAWREPAPDLSVRNMGIGSIEAGLARNSGAQVAQGYRMLSSVQKQFSQDGETFNAMGEALFATRHYDEAARAFELAVHFDPESSPKESSLGQAYLAAGKSDLAESHLEKAMKLDDMNLSAGVALLKLYGADGETAKANKLSKHLSDSFKIKIESR